MQESELAQAVAKLVLRLVSLASEDDEARTHVRAFAQQLLAATAPADTPSEDSELVADEATAGDAPLTPPAVPAPAAGELSEEIQDSEEIQEGMRAAVESMTSAPPEPPPVSRSHPTTPEVSDSDLDLIEHRCKAKAEGARWSAQRQRLIAAEADFQTDIQPRDREIIEEAGQLRDCFLWMNDRSGPSPSDLSLLDDLAGCFETTADAIALIRVLVIDSERKDSEFEQALNLLAEAQSALRGAVERVGYNKRDKDQLHTYHWLRDTCWKNRVYIQRYMRIDDVAESSEWPSLGSRIQSLDTEVRSRQERQKQHKSDLKRIGYHQKFLLDGDRGDQSHDWEVLIETVAKMVRAGTPPSNIDLRDLLLPVLEQVPDMDMPLPNEFQLVMREIDRFIATRPEPVVEEDVEAIEEVKQVAKWLTGKALVLIGGVRRPQAHEALKRAFGLKEVDWVEMDEHDSISKCECHVARPDVALVMLAIRWSSHSFGNVKEYCDRYGRPLVRLPAGYNPNQVAMQIAQQCSEQLQADGPCCGG